MKTRSVMNAGVVALFTMPLSAQAQASERVPSGTAVRKIRGVSDIRIQSFACRSVRT